MDNIDLLLRINQSYGSFSKGQKLLANYIMDNYDKAAFLTAARMGHTVGVSESTVVRFAYALGYDGYPALQRSLQELIRNRLTGVQRIQLTSDMEQDKVLLTVLKSDIANLRATIDAVDNEAFNQVVDALFSAHKTYIVGMKSAVPLAQFLGYYLNFVLDNVSIVNVSTDPYESLIFAGEHDLCIGISFPRYSTRTVQALDFAKSQGSKVVAITDSVFSPIAERADHVLLAHSDMASFADSLTAPLSLINALIVAASLRRKDEVYARLEQLESIWKREKVYFSVRDTARGDKGKS
ncbi:MAG: MurR/RpiR family transcriptional regulator [Christensenellaceae bacterium]|jgi:DNA-binding MurR/RpiR family transcriptional regulator|nr:MurR/RpiR family transcriptional regulator [Christensenellaceae bacterium]